MSDMNETETGARILAALCKGAATISEVREQACAGADDALAVLRALNQQGLVASARKRSARGAVAGPLYWYMADNPLPPLRAASKPPNAVLAMVEAAPGGHDPRARMSGIEMLARLAVRGGFPSMTGAVGTGPSITPQEISEMLVDLKDPVGVAMAVAIGCRTTRPWTDVHEFGYSRVLAAVQRSRTLRLLIRDDKRSRIRYVMHDAFHDLTFWRRTVPWTAAAKAAKMRRADYQALYVCADDVLRDAADDAGRRLFHLRRVEETYDCC